MDGRILSHGATAKGCRESRFARTLSAIRSLVGLAFGQALLHMVASTNGGTGWVQVAEAVA